MAAIFDYDALLMEENLFGSSSAFYSVKSEVSADSQAFLDSSEDSFKLELCDLLPTPPVSPSRDGDCNKEADDDLDLGIGDLLGEMNGLLTSLDADHQWFYEDLFKEATLVNPAEQDCSLLDSQVCRSEVGELRHDCMWAGTCHEEQEHSRLKKEMMLLSSSPSEPLLASTLHSLTQHSNQQPMNVTRIERRPRLDTLGSIRPETPSSLSDSELEAEHLTADSSDDAVVKDETNSESSSDEESEDEEHHKVQANIQPVRSNVRKNVATNKCSLKSTVVNSLPDHSYSHSDHSYHTQRRPQNDNLHADQLGIQTPSDSEEEIDVVSLGEVLGVSANSSSMMSSGKASIVHVAAGQTSAAHAAPLRLKLKVSPANALNGVPQATTVLMRKTLPSYPSPLDRQQLQLAVATAAQQKKQLEMQPARKAAEFGAKTTKNPSAVSGTKRPRTDSPGSSSPRKRPSRTGSDSEDSCEKRSQHNSMERQRRVDLRNAFEFLRSLIPDLEAVDRAAKVIILKKAAHYCQALTAREKKLIEEKNALQKSQEMHRKRLALLQRKR